ncbi:conjugal transfer protein TrbD [Solemya pervernicosa gill symbiont]|uniref:Conjugal transfer protein TrbD n=1 Tax=Solemya pervernicosa gill symbiont TaxID=642797 RepID=A0A1T2KZF9_9GAMM|nr:conjugal transfer protein TrbD [Solemya pervernicosa gill symbiont]OOZ38229.1 conjugal transfer protein TrbD [Solemya pervernicosa gill symbiont]
MELNRIPIHRAMNRPNLLIGGERELVLVSGLMSATLAFAGSSIATIIAGALLWFGFLSMLRMMANKDPFMSKVYLRHIKYQSFYPARSTPYRDR